MNERIERKQLENSLRHECQDNVSERVDRYLQVKPHPIAPVTHFASVSAQCALMYRDGYYYGCIALTQSVAEALVQFMCNRNAFKPEKQFEGNVRTLARRGFITADIEKYFLEIWERRDDYHHLNSSIETDREALQQLAVRKVQLLRDIEAQVFASSTIDGALEPANPKYWDNAEGYTQVYLKLDP